jgi:hypothetical protein
MDARSIWSQALFVPYMVIQEAAARLRTENASS